MPTVQQRAMGFFGLTGHTETNNKQTFSTNKLCQVSSDTSQVTDVSISQTIDSGVHVTGGMHFNVGGGAEDEHGNKCTKPCSNGQAINVRMFNTNQKASTATASSMKTFADQSCVQDNARASEQEADSKTSGLALSDTTANNEYAAYVRSSAISANKVLSATRQVLTQTLLRDYDIEGGISVNLCCGAASFAFANSTQEAEAMAGASVGNTVIAHSRQHDSDSVSQVARAVNKGLDPIAEMMGAVKSVAGSMATGMVVYLVVIFLVLSAGGGVFKERLNEAVGVQDLQTGGFRKDFSGALVFRLSLALFCLLYNVFVWPFASDVWRPVGNAGAKPSVMSLILIAGWGVLNALAAYYVGPSKLKPKAPPVSSAPVPNALPMPNAPAVSTALPVPPVPSAPPLPQKLPALL